MKTICTLLTFVGLLLSVTTAEAVEVRRFALLIGANDGGSERPRLRFAESDARAVGGVLSQMGGVERADEVYAMSPSVADVDRAFQKMTEKLQTAREDGVRLELIAYYSGHSDETGLLLGGERYSYERFRSGLESLPADVRILVLDSCASGAIIRHKGGARRASFLVDASSEVRGQAIVTSSSIDEAAQESDDLGGSYFTHFLVSGLRGAADRNADSRVTLTEAYEYAFSNTLQVTNETAAGPQHPAYDFQLMGHGDIVLTMFTPTTSTLEIGQKVVGRVFVWTAAERLAVEVPKEYGKTLELGLPAGKYSVTVTSGGDARRADVDLPKVGRRRLELHDFRFYELRPTRSRGSENEERRTDVATTSTPPRLPWYRHVFLPAAGVSAVVAAIALGRSASLERQESEAWNDVYEQQSEWRFGSDGQFLPPPEPYREAEAAREYGESARKARTVAWVSGSIAAVLVFTDVAFRIASRSRVAIGLQGNGGVYVRTNFY